MRAIKRFLATCLLTCMPALAVLADGPVTVTSFDAQRSYTGYLSQQSYSFSSGAAYGAARYYLSSSGSFVYEGTPQVTAAMLQASDIFVVNPVSSALSEKAGCLLDAYVRAGGALLEIRNLPYNRPPMLDTGTGPAGSGSTIQHYYNPLIDGPFGWVYSVSMGANYAFAPTGESLAITGQSGAGPNMLLFGPESRFSGAGGAVLIGDEEVFITGDYSGERWGALGHNYYNRVLLENTFAYLSAAPGLSSSVDFSICEPVVDQDGDGVEDGDDNCPLTPNPDQADNDHDGVGDVCDADDDNDGVLDGDDNCASIANPLQFDLDQDGIGDACDPDDDGDGVDDTADNCPVDANADQMDADLDGIGDVCDPDDDNDGILDGGDNCPWVANTDQSDFDGDSFGDACDSDIDGDGVGNSGDTCPGTLAGPVDANGCSIDQLIDLACGDATNHGQYVSCVAHVTKQAQRDGLITQPERTSEVTGAAHSSKGKK